MLIRACAFDQSISGVIESVNGSQGFDFSAGEADTIEVFTFALMLHATQ